MDYEEVGGAPLLGIKGCAIVSHGKSGPKAIKNAIFQAIAYTETGVNEHIVSRIAELKEKQYKENSENN
jgi:glycerol-3-phosphate acyltransferase PlsX